MKKVALMKSNKCNNLKLVVLMLHICWPHAELLWGGDNKDTHDLEQWYSQGAKYLYLKDFKLIPNISK